jgi:hypothetical protein
MIRLHYKEIFMKIKPLLNLILMLLIVNTAWASLVREDAQEDFIPSGKGYGELPKHAKPGQELANEKEKGNPSRAPAALRGTSTSGIGYHGGPLMTSVNGTTMYYIWYGNWSGNSASSILSSLASSIAPSPYFRINTTYYNAQKTPITNLVTFGGGLTNNYSYGTTLSDSQVRAVVTDSIQGGQLPADPNAVYFVLTSADVNESSGFCTQYCGWHSNTVFNNVDIKYSFVGNAQRCPNACAAQTTKSPNGNVGADAMASIIAHELVEAVTDPDLNAWYDKRGYENADKCAWKFGTTYTAAGGSLANMKLGGLDFLIQQNWLNSGSGSCATFY